MVLRPDLNQSFPIKAIARGGMNFQSKQMKQLPQKPLLVPTGLLHLERAKALVTHWLTAWQREVALEETDDWASLIDKAISWLEAVHKEGFATDNAQVFWQELSALALTTSHWNNLIIQLATVVEEQQWTNRETIIDAALDARQQYSWSSKIPPTTNKQIFLKRKAIDHTTTIRNSNSTIMNEEKTNYQDLLQQTVDASFCRVEFDRTGTITAINQTMIELLGYTAVEELVGKKSSILAGREDEEENREEFWASLASGFTQKGQYRCVTKTGEEVWLQASYTPLTNEEGEVIRVINIGMDISQQKRESLSAEALKEAVDRSFARIEYDLNGQIIDGNRGFLKVSGYEDIATMNKNSTPMFMEEGFVNSPAYTELWDKLKNGESQSAEYKRVNLDGDFIWTQTVFVPVKDEEGNVNRVIEIASDITSQKEFLSEINRVIEIAGQEGKLDARLNASTASGDWKNLASSVNLLLESVALPVSELGEVVGSLAKGDLSVEFDSFVEGDIKELGDELNSAIGSIANLMAQISQIGDLVAASAEEMLVKGEEMKNTTLEVASATQQMAEGAQQQAQQTDEASKMMDIVLVSVDSMAKKASKINESANKGQENSTKGLETIKLVGENMSQIKDSASTTSMSIETFAERSEEIASALSVITDIASQTNLLALNAAIEAARAGDAGRGFAVVAEEIRKLAEGSRRSAIDIEKVIREVHKDINSASKAIDNMERSVKSGIDASKKAEAVFESIEVANKETLNLSNEIVEATEEQRSSIHATAKNIEKIVIVAEETASGTEQVASSSRVLSQGMNEVTATSEDLANVATQLQESISKFKLPE